MRNRIWISMVAVLAVLALALPLMARPATETVTLHEPAKLADAYLKAGTYNLKIDGDTVVVLRGKKVVAEAKGRWVEAPAKVERSATVSRDGQILEFRFRGRDQVLRFD